MNQNQKDDLPIFVQWEKFLEWLMPTLEKFPKKVRFTLTNRIQNLALDMVETLVEARYTRNKIHHLKTSNLTLEKIRILLRLSHTFQHLPNKQYEYAMRELHEIGKMLGGWIRTQEQK